MLGVCWFRAEFLCHAFPKAHGQTEFPFQVLLWICERPRLFLISFKATTLNLILLFLTWIEIAPESPMGCEGVTVSSLSERVHFCNI